MSNVLIGIIGVILFIGLALAGALFLGPRFQESTNNSRGSAAVQVVSQISSAVNMSRVQEGTSIMANAAVSTLTPGYLKSVPANPTSDIYNPLFSTAAGTRTATDTADYVVMQLGTNAAAVCSAVAKQSGQTLGANDAPPETATVLPAAPAGCVKVTKVGGIGTALTENGFYVFARA